MYKADLSPPARYLASQYEEYYFQVSRELYQEQLGMVKMDKMPGFRVKWFYNVELPPESKFNDSKINYANIEFTRQIDLVLIIIYIRFYIEYLINS